MDKEDYPMCCAAVAFTTFGGDVTRNRHRDQHSKEDIKDFFLENFKRSSNLGVCTAITTDLQTEAIAALTELGFESGEWMNQDKHPGRQLKLWWYPLTDDPEAHFVDHAEAVQLLGAVQAAPIADEFSGGIDL